MLSGTSPVSVETAYLGVSARPDSVKTVLAGPVFMRRYTYSAAGLVDSVIPGGAGLAWTPRQYVYNAARGTLSGIRLGVPT
ncbi:MAG: hypothetical protein ACREJ4_13555 [Candidatus Methylomirabilaceae bacterium]